MVAIPAGGADVAAPSRDTHEWVVFGCAGHWFGVPLDRIREILPPQRQTRMPGCGPEVAGLFGLRGRVVTAFDFGALLTGTPAATNPKHRLLLLEHGARLVAAAVDAVIGVAQGEARALEIAGDELRALEAAPAEVVGIGAFGERPFTALEPDRLLERLLA